MKNGAVLKIRGWGSELKTKSAWRWGRGEGVCRTVAEHMPSCMCESIPSTSDTWAESTICRLAIIERMLTEDDALEDDEFPKWFNELL